MGQFIRKQSKMRAWLPLYTMLIPGFVYMLINNYLPMGGLLIAFKNYNFQKGFWGSNWVGFENFRYLFLTPDAFRITRNTILYNLLFIVLNTVVAVALAILISEVVSRKLQKLYQTSIFLPYLVSMVIVSYIGFSLLSTDTGFINNSILAPLGKESISFYNQTTYWPLILAFVNCWKSVGYSCVIYLSAILGIDREMYEAADLDGAGKMKQIRHITLPNLRPTVIMLTLMSIGRMFYSDFGLFYQVPLNSSAIRNVTDTIDTYVFRALLETGDIGMSSAAGFYQSIVGLILVLVANGITRKVSKDDALF